MEQESLKPCPFCGGEARTRKGVKTELWFMDCPNCCMDFCEQTEDELIARWNARAAVTDDQFARAAHDGRAWQVVRECRWEAVTNPRGEVTEFMCECGCCMGYVPNFCPNCGAKVIPC